MLVAIEMPLRGGGEFGGLIIALAICVLLGRFVYKSFNEPVDTWQRVLAGGLLLLFFGGIIAVAITEFSSSTS